MTPNSILSNYMGLAMLQYVILHRTRIVYFESMFTHLLQKAWRKAY